MNGQAQHMGLLIVSYMCTGDVRGIAVAAEISSFHRPDWRGTGSLLPPGAFGAL